MCSNISFRLFLIIQKKAFTQKILSFQTLYMERLDIPSVGMTGKTGDKGRMTLHQIICYELAITI